MLGSLLWLIGREAGKEERVKRVHFMSKRFKKVSDCSAITVVVAAAMRSRTM